MPSPQLPGILRAYWKLARPTTYLFPGRDEERPIDPTAPHAACRSAVKAAGLSKRVDILRDEVAGIGRGNARL
jgi:hypothetical protein